MYHIILFGKFPPPIGGVTIHVYRLAHWLGEYRDVHINVVQPSFIGFIKLISYFIFNRNKKTILHLQTSNPFALIFSTFFKIATLSKIKIVKSIHSEYWFEKNLIKSKFITIINFCLKRLDGLICDSSAIAVKFVPIVKHVKVIIPFLPPSFPKTELKSISYYLQFNFDNGCNLIFNAYKLVENSSGKDVYGLDILFEALPLISKKTNVILLIPVVTDKQKKDILNFSEIIHKINHNVNLFLFSDASIEGWKIIASADIFVRPTRTDGDALSVREALYFNTVCISSNAAQRPVGTILFESENPYDLADKINSTVINHKNTKNNAFPDISVINNPSADFRKFYLNILKIKND